MSGSFWHHLKGNRSGGVLGASASIFHRLLRLLEIPAPEAEQWIRRITIMERHMMLPIKAAGIAMIYSFYFTSWISAVHTELELAVEAVQSFFWVYVGINVVAACLLLAMRRLPLSLMQWVVFSMILLDGLFLSALTLVTGGYQSILFWLFLGLIVRSAVSVPRATSQILLNLTIVICYVVAGVIEISIGNNLEEHFRAQAATERLTRKVAKAWHKRSQFDVPATAVEGQTNIFACPFCGSSQVRSIRPCANSMDQAVFCQNCQARGPIRPSQAEAVAEWNKRGLHTELNPRIQIDPSDVDSDEAYRGILGLTGSAENPTEPLMLRLMLLLLMTVCSYAAQVLLERQRQVEEEAREFGLREGQLRSAARLAAEFAHQLKNPLAIINNAAYSLQRALKERKADVAEQLRIIQEEVEHSDRIITQVMGYAQLTEGRVEKLNVIEELDHAIQQVFPAAAGFPVQIYREYGASFPPLLMLRRHVSETFLNVLQNAREALNGNKGVIRVAAHCRSDYAVEVTIGDNGPGIPADKLEKVFEAYHTTKEKGTGLGLATVKHNVELYGGTVRVESELGKGARFILVFPAKSFIRLMHTN